MPIYEGRTPAGALLRSRGACRLFCSRKVTPMMEFPAIARQIAVTLLASAAFGQVSGGAFRGEVRDASNAVVPQAHIAIRSNDTGTVVFSESNGDGLYVTPTLIPGSYVLSATKPEFETEEFGPVTLQVNQIVRVDFA